MEKAKYILIKSAIVFVIVSIIFVVYVAIRGFNNVIFYCDGAFLVAMVAISIGGLAWVASVGGFDGVSYSTYYMFVGSRTIKEKRKYKSYTDYMEQKRDKRKGNFYTITPYFICGIIYLIASVILYFFI